MRAPGRRTILAALSLAVWFVPAGATAQPTPRTYLILPFEDNNPDPARYWLREAMAFSLADQLMAAGQNVVSRDALLMAMDTLGLPNGASMSWATSIKLGRTMREQVTGPKPDRLIIGQFSVAEGRLRLSGRVLELASNRAGAWKQYEGSLKDLLRIQEALALGLLREEGILGNLRERASDDAEAGSDFPLMAYENYVRARIEPDDTERRALLRKAIQQYPGYPKASFQLGRLLFREGDSSGAAVVLGRIAGEPLPYSAEYHALLGHLALEKGRIPLAEEEARKSMASRETADGRILLARLEQAKDNSAAARREMERARQLDPDHPELELLIPLLEGETASEDPEPAPPAENPGSG